MYRENIKSFEKHNYENKKLSNQQITIHNKDILGISGYFNGIFRNLPPRNTCPRLLSIREYLNIGKR